MNAYRFRDLFAQLGLPADEASIGHFLRIHARAADGLRLPEAPCWSPAQAEFLRDALTQDSDWSGLADQLGAVLWSMPR